MPNWVFSQLIIEGDNDEIKDLIEYSKGKDWENSDVDELSAAKYIPIPADVFKGICLDCGYESAEINSSNKVCPKCNSTNTKDWYNNKGYDWCINNWGTKWGFVHPTLEALDDGYAQYSFDTAWSTILPVIKAMSEKYTKLKFKYTVNEESGLFCGYYIIKDGHICEHIIDMMGD